MKICNKYTFHFYTAKTLHSAKLLVNGSRILFN